MMVHHLTYRKEERKEKDQCLIHKPNTEAEDHAYVDYAVLVSSLISVEVSVEYAREVVIGFPFVGMA